MVILNVHVVRNRTVYNGGPRCQWQACGRDYRRKRHDIVRLLR
jgi:hypothetical protein